MKGYVLGFMFSEDRKHVVLIRKNKPAWQAGKLNGVGGKIEQDELPLAAMVREFQEETGARWEEWRHFASMTNSQFIVYCYVAFASGLYVESKTDEAIIKVSVDDLLTGHFNTINNIKWLVSMAMDNGFEPVTITYHEEDKYKEPVQ
jgi:8-oxo-dGTP diphosphatase